MQPGLGLSFIFVCLWVPNCTSNTGCKLGSPSSDCFYASVKDRLEIVTSVCFQALCSSESICVMGHTVLMTPALEEVFRPGGMISFALFFLNVARVIFSLHMCILKVLLEFSTNKKRQLPGIWIGITSHLPAPLGEAGIFSLVLSADRLVHPVLRLSLNSLIGILCLSGSKSCTYLGRLAVKYFLFLSYHK